MDFRRLTPKIARRVVGLELAKRRDLLGLTQQELADRAGIDNTLISRLESGDRDIRRVGYEIVMRLALALEADPRELFPIDLDEPALPTPEEVAR